MGLQNYSTNSQYSTSKVEENQTIRTVINIDYLILISFDSKRMQ